MEAVKIKLSDEVLAEFITLFEMVRDSQFEIGDRLIEQVKLHGDKAGVINEVASQLNVSASVLYDYYRTAERWSPAMREIYQNLDYTIYRNSDPNDPSDIELLDKAIDEGWNATKFKEEKYDTIKDPSSIFNRVRSIFVRYMKDWRPEIRTEVESILDRLDKLLRLYTS
jgi:hypothetical protein